MGHKPRCSHCNEELPKRSTAKLCTGCKGRLDRWVCSCECHDEDKRIIHFMECCAFTYTKRSVLAAWRASFGGPPTGALRIE